MKQHILVLLIASLLAISSLGIGLSVIDGAPQRGGDRDLTLEGDGEQTTADDSETEVVEDEGPCYGNITLFKYYDVDGNGEYDGDDYPIGKWYFEVYRKVENPPELHGLNIETETDVSPVWDLYDSGYTAGDGYLTIEIECNRHYKVVEYLDQFEEEWYFTGGKVVGGSADDDDFEDKDGQVEITFWDRCEDVEIWFGNAQEEIYGDITVSKFHDENHDGEWNSDEELIDGFYFQLWYADEDGTPIAPIGDPMETSDGIYTFEDLELGNYVVQEIMPEVGEEECCWASTTGLLQHVEVYDDEMYNLYFGNVRGGSIEGMKFLDIEADGNFDVGMDKPLMDWQIYLWTNVDGGPGEVVDTTYTDRMGDFYFDCVAPGEYFVQEEMYEGWYNVKPDVVPVYVESCETSEKIEFANCMFKDIYGIKYFDYNQTGSFDQEVDWVLGGWPIQLLNEDEEVIQTTETQPNGYYFFEGLKVGTYYVEELIPEDEDPEAWVNTTESKVEVVMTCCNSCTLVNFGNYQYPEVTIVKYHDTNMNGIYDIDEELVIESVWFDVEGYNDIGPFLPYELEVFGEWSFYTDEGHYTITERLPEGWHNTTPLMQSFTLGPADEVTVEFGNVKYGHIEVYKFYDEDMNSEWDDGEEMLSGWEFNLWTTDEDGLPDETIHTNETGECGCYVFEDLLPGLYAVQEIEQCCWFPTTDVIQYVEVVAGETAEAWFGNVEGGWIWGYKYCDVNMNQEFDEDECGTEDVTINLWSVNETTGEPEVILETTTTDETGYYEFMCLEPGEYYVQED
ncbi:MAG: MSCRAMM family protein, partial [Candidatus Natronoplasma sp.]